MSTSTTSCCTTISAAGRDIFPATGVCHFQLPSNNSAPKRKHEQLDEPLETWDPFNIQFLQSSTDSRSPLLTPRMLLPRSSLPLAYLNPNGENESFPCSRLFAASISPLEGKNDAPNPSQPVLLIAQDENMSRFYAIENLYKGVYTLCRLGTWVTEAALRSLTDDIPSIFASSQGYDPQNLDRPANEWWRVAALPSHTAAPLPISTNSATARARSFKLSLKRPPNSANSYVGTCRTFPELKSPQTDALGPDETRGLQESVTVLNNIRKHYLEALYLSRTSLAYFAKGPLSRARASFQRQDGTASDYVKLTQYLRTIILTLPLMDKKYRETIPTLVKQFPSSTLSEGECASMIESTMKKSRRSKKDKLNKGGLYAGEDVDIARWWLGREVQCVITDTDEGREESFKTIIREQRTREAQLQIIILLETLALEASTVSRCEKVLPADNSIIEHHDAIGEVKRAKKQRDLHTLLDLLADRLCIWHSMSAEPDIPSASQHQESNSRNNVEDKKNDHLRQFCIDVVLPFYGARLPDVSALLCQKFGGPKNPSPKRPPPTDLKAASQENMKPGAPIPRSGSRKHRRTLERVLTDDRSRHKRQLPTLARSATEPILQVKREVRDTSLSSIPLNKVPISKRYTQREIDLQAASQNTKSKHKKMKLDQELQGAIAAIKRPDPKMAGREFVETVEKRQGGSYLQKRKNPVPNTSAHHLQVMATPSRKKRNLPAKLPSIPQTQSAETCEADGLPSSNISCLIPSSTRKVPAMTATVDEYFHDNDKFTVDNVDETPSKGSARFLDDASFLGSGERTDAQWKPSKLSYSLLKPPDEPWRSSTGGPKVQEAIPVEFDSDGRASPLPTFIPQATPCKQSLSQAPNRPALSPAVLLEESDIYASLGWNNDVDD